MDEGNRRVDCRCQAPSGFLMSLFATTKSPTIASLLTILRSLVAHRPSQSRAGLGRPRETLSADANRSVHRCQQRHHYGVDPGDSETVQGARRPPAVRHRDVKTDRASDRNGHETRGDGCAGFAVAVTNGKGHSRDDRSLRGSTCSAWREQLDIPVLVPSGGNPNAHGFVERLCEQTRAEVALSYYCGTIWRTDLLRAFNQAVNYHDGYLPWYRGVGATSFSIYNGEQESGFTFTE